MSTKAYMLLDVRYGKVEQVAEVLKNRPGVVVIDILEGPPDLLIMIEAADRQKLVKFTIEALTLVESMTEGTYLLPVHNGLMASTE